MRLPVIKTIRNGAVLATRVGRRHLWIFAVFAVLYSIIQFDNDTMASRLVLGETSWINPIARGAALLAGSLFIAIIVHREILVGPTPFLSLISRPGFGRMGWYFLDVVAIIGLLLVPIILMAFAVVFLEGAKPEGQSTGNLLVIVLAYAIALIGARLWLKLPACAIDEPLTWRQVWALGRGNNLRLFIAVILTDSLLSWLAGAITSAVALVSPILAQAISAIFAIALAVLTTAWLSVAYLYLTVGDPAAPAEARAEPGRE